MKIQKWPCPPPLYFLDFRSQYILLVYFRWKKQKKGIFYLKELKPYFCHKKGILKRYIKKYKKV